MKNKYFDHILGKQKDNTSEQDQKLTKNILDAYIKELPKEELQENQKIGIKLRMKSYLNSDAKETIEAGEFLNNLFTIYNIKKSRFAEFIGIENGNLHALLKGRRKFNSKIATIVGETFSIDPQLWMFIEAKNDLLKFNSTFENRAKKVDLAELSHDR
jgi:plasmid maintenance system antidote protein VapI